MSEDFEILTESELTTLETSSGDDCCMASVKCVVRELRGLRTQLAQVTKERDLLHASLKAIADLCIDKGGLRVVECVAVDAPPQTVAKIIEQRDVAIARAEQAERATGSLPELRRERDEAYKATNEINAKCNEMRRERDAAIARTEQAERERNELLERATRLARGEHPVDWACVECRPNSTMLVAGFRCDVHAVRAYRKEQP